ALITGIVDWARTRGVGFSHVVSLGEMADVDFGDMLDYLAGDRASRAILLYMESVTHAPKFMSAARRAARSKPVIVVKSGRHAAGAKAARSHTGAMAGADSAYEAAFHRAGLVRVNELHELFDAAEILARMPALKGEGLTILTNGGGAGVLAADRLSDIGGLLTELSEPTRSALDGVLPATWSKANPIDIIGDANEARYTAALDIVLSAPETDAVLVINCPTALASSEGTARAVVTSVGANRGSDKCEKPVLTNWLGDTASKSARVLFAENGIATFETPADAIGAFGILAGYRRAQVDLMRTPRRMPTDAKFHRDAVADVLDRAHAAGQKELTEIDAKHVMAAYGIPVAETRKAVTVGEAREIAAGLLKEHDACVIKILSNQISHKSDVGGVRLGLQSIDDVALAFEDMVARVGRLRPDAKIIGVTVQPMIERPGAHELIAGMAVDEAFGPIIMFGAGGTSVEVVRDIAYALPPLDLELANDLIRRPRIASLLRGYRDRPEIDVEALAETLVRLSYLVANHPEIREVDINPLLADGSGVIALDARVAIADPAVSPRTAMAIRPYPAQWECEVEVAAVGRVLVRPIRPEDEALYEDFFAHVSRDDMRLRFFTARPPLSHAFVARLTQVDYGREMAFVALQPVTGELLGVVRLMADADYERAEYGVLVRSNLKGAGLGWALMQHMIAYAREEGLREIYGSVLAENTTMLGMCRRLGFSVETTSDDVLLRTVRLDPALVQAVS
ncbi:MAG TPA: bifunctional acetate--CoA ligase family protein/GNAT family N-acetyltransferase, partial [Hyphomicrobiaceae bacterium]|nr:bifunctional acetate--CoA ligase family protein/GNAT family N-acetyltransferase [Hyphomicrobiaceae bacterium]